MPDPLFTLYPCISFCLSGDEQDPCAQHAEPDLLEYLEAQIIDRDISATVSPTGCAECCSRGPLITVQPGDQRHENLYNRVAVDRLLDHLVMVSVSAA